jgi:ribose transport system permease protein/erythritol transport system permease protein
MVITWLNAGILLAFQGNLSGQIQLLALGILLIGSALLNGFTNRRFAGAR